MNLYPAVCGERERERESEREREVGCPRSKIMNIMIGVGISMYMVI